MQTFFLFHFYAGLGGGALGFPAGRRGVFRHPGVFSHGHEPPDDWAEVTPADIRAAAVPLFPKNKVRHQQLANEKPFKDSKRAHGRFLSLGTPR